MSILTHHLEDVFVVAPGRKLSVTEGEGELSAAVQKGMEEGFRKVLLDLTAVEFIDSLGVGQIVASLVSIQNRGGKLILCGVGSRVALVLRMANLHLALDIKEGGPGEMVWG
ncbi:MAG: STAS domain-containing protein [Holophagaceae bacterium]